MNRYDLLLQLAPHSELQVEASAVALKDGIAKKVMIIGGEKARTAKYCMVNQYKAPSDRIIVEARIDFKEYGRFANSFMRHPLLIPNQTIGLINCLYRMEIDLPIVRLAGIPALPVFTENLLSQDSLPRINEFSDFYRNLNSSATFSGKQYDVDRIRHLLATGQGLAEMLG